MPASALAAELSQREKERLLSIPLEQYDDDGRLREVVLGIPEPRGPRGYVSHGLIGPALVAPLFFDQPFIDICGICEIGEDSANLAALIDSGVVVPLLHAGYAAYPPELLQVLGTRRHVSLDAKVTLARTRARLQGEICPCPKCAEAQITRTSRLPPRLRNDIKELAAFDLVGLPGSIQADFVAPLNVAITSGDRRRIHAEISRIQKASFVNYSGAMAAVPQFLSSDFDSSSFPLDAAARSLAIAYSPDIPVAKYLEIILEHRLALTSVAQTDCGDLLDRLKQINGEVSDLGRSFKAKLFGIGTDVIVGERNRVIEAALVGLTSGVTLGPIVGAACATAALGIDKVAKAGTQVPGISKATAVAASTILGASVPAVHIWSIQRKLRSVRQEL